MRLWRARKRNHAVDALVDTRDGRVDLTLVLNGRLLYFAEFTTDNEAKAAAETKLKDLQRAGWNVHW